ncbi:MAG TPA: hypothetical protein VE714_02120, partial [Gemmatimonadales bacterium]|nr:hypothetical protein [Gemmatimonadales bacterium]
CGVALVMAVTFDVDERRSAGGVVTGDKCSRSLPLARIPGASQIVQMIRGYQPVRHQVERRVRPDRRSGLDRRITDRRQRDTAVFVERRGLTERRSRIERRSPGTRRQLKDRRGSGRTLTTV